MTPLPSKERLEARQTYCPTPGSVTASDLCRMTHRKKKHLSDWAVGCLAYGILTRRITRHQADIFESVFVRGAKLRKTRKCVGDPFLGPDDLVVVVQDVKLVGDDTDGAHAAAATIHLEELILHPKHREWADTMMTGLVEEGDWPDELTDSEDESAGSTPGVESGKKESNPQVKGSSKGKGKRDKGKGTMAAAPGGTTVEEYKSELAVAGIAPFKNFTLVEAGPATDTGSSDAEGGKKLGVQTRAASASTKRKAAAPPQGSGGGEGGTRKRRLRNQK